MDSPKVVATQRFDLELLRRDGTRFPGGVPWSKIKGEPIVSGFFTDATERVRREAEREALMREQAARAEAGGSPTWSGA